MISGKNICKKYGNIEVLRGVEIEISRGELVSIIGPSGSGKSTLLHILGTLDKADAGEVSMFGTNTSSLSGKKLADFRNKHIGFIFQFHHLLPEFSALENVCIPGWLGRRSKQEVRQQAEDLLAMVGMSHRLQHKPGALSGGEQQRVAVARALVNNPDIVFADEPTGNLDSANAEELFQLFLHLKSTLQQTFLIVTHNEMLSRLSNRVLSMKDGRVG